MKTKTILVFGNEDLQMDSMPFKILPKLKETFPEINFETVDPNEEWKVSEEVWILDTAMGINDVTFFDSLDKFKKPPRVSMHDFDALTNLHYLWKLGKIKKINIIALPMEIDESKAFEETFKILKNI